MALSVSLICENSRRRARNTKKAVCESISEPPNADAVFERSFNHKPVVDFRRGLCTVSGVFLLEDERPILAQDLRDTFRLAVKTT